ncbi:hypothetical protein CHGG_01484 [Chaetomium globosum CBS 148.51]|uniref:Uncharacterized protein n=1 Tax=Chaetomium globosum (strain ATCC 6205 / CBS 148.51 / DSM 1962 / NBRC 6347 / NRRL 1970) TaxID=306901 RepID=Q2HE70_CHAGB|nr:uncharacterized protein CHGG_01484 [Chaetomium globosum CBS 148.51]EAQ93249.1 hypothetical protein CHGG_01484 [Chaetomium globosum CBS 148.51]
MRVTSIFLAAGLALFANAQTTTGGDSASKTVDAATAAQTSAQAEMLRCLNACDADDVNCRAKCIAVPSPNDQQANATNTCVAGCPVGKGTEADNNAYAKCVGDCIGQNYYTPTIGTPQPTGGSNSGNGNNGNGNGNNNNGNGNSDGDNNGNNDDATNTGDSEGSQTSDSPSTTESTGAAALLGVSSGVVGAVGFVAAIMAL